jgi:hypothetical protein
MTNQLLLCLTLQLGLLAWAVYWWISRHDEIPLLVAGFFLFCGSFRGTMVAVGFAQPIGLGDFFQTAGTESSITALWLILTGETVLLLSYALNQRSILPIQMRGFPQRQRETLVNAVFLLFLIIFPLSLRLRGYVGAEMAAGKSLAFEVSSYASLFPMALVGVAVLVICVWRFGLLKSIFQKIFAGLILASIAWFTFGPSLRFLFLGWLLGGGVIWSATAKANRRLLGFMVGGLLALCLFGLAGAMRNTASDQDIGDAAIERLASGGDANMLDGFVMLLQVYPKMLPYSYGQEHLNILLRPIPRALWPGKPVGGYMNQLGMFNAGSSGTTGISPTLFGSFYAEGGVVGIIILSTIYGYLIGRFISWSVTLPPFLSIMVRACVLAGLLPLLRGGDLPGTYAWLGMCFWPCVLVFLWLRGSYNGSRKRYGRKSKAITAVAPENGIVTDPVNDQPSRSPRSKFRGRSAGVKQVSKSHVVKAAKSI